MSAAEIVANERLIESIKNNHQILFLLSVGQLIKLYEETTSKDVVKATKTGAGYASAVLDISVLTKMLRELGVTGRVLQKKVGEKSYVIFKGYPGLRNTFTGPRYLASNAKVVDMAIGKAGIQNSLRSGARLTIFLTVPLVALEHILKDKFLLSNLVADLAVSMVKVGVATIVSAVAATAIGTVTTVAAAPLAVAIFVGLIVAWGLDKLDEKFAITKLLGEVLREIENNTVGKFERGLWELERTLRWQILHGESPGKGIFYP
ncbi:hypothetical protein [Thalassomonas sp. RHCl1]|uniref:hypothetical protein n=1 Tax=Thalassomonas sp. RHCl1 TaxID=2995320 RepID=UPI00248AD0D3|nr:hypothetical protein [Thalassomonas sp. RHCl1]